MEKRLQAMHRRAQAAEGKLDRMTRFVRIVVETMSVTRTFQDRMVLQSLKAALRHARAVSGSYSLAVWAWQTTESNKQKARAEAAEAALNDAIVLLANYTDPFDRPEHIDVFLAKHGTAS